MEAKKIDPGGWLFFYAAVQWQCKIRSDMRYDMITYCCAGKWTSLTLPQYEMIQQKFLAEGMMKHKVLEIMKAQSLRSVFSLLCNIWGPPCSRPLSVWPTQEAYGTDHCVRLFNYWPTHHLHWAATEPANRRKWHTGCTVVLCLHWVTTVCCLLSNNSAM